MIKESGIYIILCSLFIKACFSCDGITCFKLNQILNVTVLSIKKYQQNSNSLKIYFFVYHEMTT